MRILNTKDLAKVADPKDVDRLTKEPEPEPDLRLQALEKLTQTITDMLGRQDKVMNDLLRAIVGMKDKSQIDKQILAIEQLDKTITSSMAAYTKQVTTVLSDIKSDKTQPDATDRLTRVVAMLTEQKSSMGTETLMKLDQMVAKLSLIGEREPVVNVDNPVTVKMPEPANEFRVDVVRTPQGLIDHAVIKRQQ